MEIICAKI